MRWIKARTIENVIHYYRLDLEEMESTGETPEKWTTSEMKNIIKYGIIAKKSRSHGTPWSLTPMALDILEEMEALSNRNKGG